MKGYLTLCSLAASVVISASCEASEQAHATRRPPSKVYVSGDNTSVLAIIDGSLYIGNLSSDDRYEIIPQVIGSQGRLESRSNAQIECVFSSNITFAVPRSRHLSQHFECNGVQFLVEQCNGTKGTESCESYEIVAQCRQFQNGRCVSAGEPGGEPVMAYRFRGSTHAGITEINFDPGSERHRLTLRQGQGIFGMGGAVAATYLPPHGVIPIGLGSSSSTAAAQLRADGQASRVTERDASNRQRIQENLNAQQRRAQRRRGGDDD